MSNSNTIKSNLAMSLVKNDDGSLNLNKTAFTDTDTGESRDDLTLAVNQKQERLGWDDEGFHMSNHAFMKENMAMFIFPIFDEKLAEMNKKLSDEGKKDRLKPMNLTDMRVLFYLESKVMRYNLIPVNPSKISRQTGMERASVSRSLKKLKMLNVLTDMEITSREKLYMMNPDFTWNGNIKERPLYVSFYWRASNGKVGVDEIDRFFSKATSETVVKRGTKSIPQSLANGDNY